MAVTMCGCKSAEDRKGRCVDPQTSYAGAVLATGEHNILDDSYFYALVWDGSRLIEVEYGATAWWSYHNGAQVDATDDVRAAALEWYRPTVDPEMTALRWVESESVHPYWNRAAQLGRTHEQRREP
jgi:hypothetical protein